uniref:Uncharacterized protein n=1 Tax=Ananas comosus var. bracteatus TaxID=296719 RepID=A0A6V7P494_ANACO|nr:unnamed protein product [Ananas comosus var. bracteatus]
MRRRRRRRRRRRGGGGSSLWTWSISFPLPLFPPCWCLKAWTWSLQERRSSPLELGLELLGRLVAHYSPLDLSCSQRWFISSLLTFRILRDLWTTPFGETKDYETVRWV